MTTEDKKRRAYRESGWEMGKLDKAFSVILILLILGALGAVGYIVAVPKVGERFTEFYVLGLEGKAIDYPEVMKVGEEARVIIGIINHEQKTVSYGVKVKIHGVTNNELEPIVLRDEQKWEEIVGFTPDRVGDNQKVEFVLYKNSESEPHLKPLHLWINVKEQK